MNIKNLLCLVSMVALAAGSFAQTLPELAKAEKARRAKIHAAGAEAKLYTEGDRSGGAIPAAGSDGSATADPATAGAAAPAKKSKEKTPEELAAERQKEWTDKVTKAQGEIKDLEGLIATNERNLASQVNITPARADLDARIQADRKKLADLKQSLVNLEEERRRAGMPRPR